MTTGNSRVGILHVRQIDIDHAVEQRERLGTVVAARVVDERQSKAALRSDHERLEDLSHHVTGCHQIDVVTAPLLELQHRVGKLVRTYFVALSQLGDVVVLAEDAAQIAPGKEDRAGPSRPAERPFLAVVRAKARDHGSNAGAADRPFYPEVSVDAAVPRAEIAAREMGSGTLRPSGQFARSKKGQVDGLDVGLDGRGVRQSRCGATHGSPRIEWNVC
jgi:hypothetical protein